MQSCRKLSLSTFREDSSGGCMTYSRTHCICLTKGVLLVILGKFLKKLLQLHSGSNIGGHFGGFLHFIKVLKDVKCYYLPDINNRGTRWTLHPSKKPSSFGVGLVKISTLATWLFMSDLVSSSKSSIIIWLKNYDRSGFHFNPIVANLQCEHFIFKFKKKWEGN